MTAQKSIAIVGGGTVGLYLAAALADSTRVTVFEADLPSDAAPEALFGPRRDLGSHDGSRTGWRSGLGGTSKIWGGQLLPWEEWEFEGVGGPAWPIRSSEVTALYGRVRSRLGLAPIHSQIHNTVWRKTSFAGGDLSIRRSTWMSPSERDFTRNPALRHQLHNVRVEREYLVTTIDSSSKGYAIIGGRRGQSQLSGPFDEVVLSAGVLGNVRLLDRYFRGEKSSLIGAGFMDHISARVARMRVSDWSRFREHAAQRRIHGVLTSIKYVSTPELVRRQAIQPGYAHWEFDISQSALAKTLAARRLKRLSVAQLVAESGALIRSMRPSISNSQRLLPEFAVPYLRVDVEQLPSPDRSLVWHTESDQGAMHIRWGVSDEDLRSIRVIGDRVLSALDDEGIGATSDQLIETLSPIDTKHMMGGARMGSTSAESVVDSWGSVHGSRGLWVAGASVFPSGGVANPTFTALALAERMADALKT